ncbi:MAG: tRNA 2-thiocytidine biosynthesis protein TtcA [Clostridiales bacterium]|jgi:tRNA(Ile)-lysidine synthase TilS/MesJ|nr:tRNA 2-thiocytidine biosynthesis protein TtcA [Clostridiales bacterium]
MEKYKQIERSIITTYRSQIWKKFVAAINEYELIKDGDRIAVCISGGKDSMLMAKCFQELQRHGRKNFDAAYLVMDPGYNEINRLAIENNAKLLNIPVKIFESDIFSAVENVGGAPCYLCARMRRGCLYAEAKSAGCNKIALGHHFDDVTETVLMGILYNGRIQSMPPKLKSDNFENMELIRPMYRVYERDIINWKNYNGLSFIQCACRFTENCTLCDNAGGGGKRQEMKNLIKTLKKNNPNVAVNIFRSMYNINLDTVVGYKKDGAKHTFLEDYDNSAGE